MGSPAVATVYKLGIYELLLVHNVIQSLCQPILTCFCSDHFPCTQNSLLFATVFVPKNHFLTTLLYITGERAGGNPSAIEGQTANILTSRTGL